MRRNGWLQRGGFRSSMSSAGNIVSSLACALALVCAASLSAHAQAVFQAATSTYNVGSGPEGVAVADLNRDGQPDAIVADTSANQISVILSSGSSYVVNNYSTGGGSSPVAVAVVPDYASQGAPAVAVLEQGSSTVAIYTVSSAGALTLGTTYTVGAAPTGIIAADFNNDGIQDLAISYPTGVSILLGSVSGTFSNGAGDSVGTNLVALAAGHFDTTGDMDLAVVDQAAKMVYILAGDGSGGFIAGSGFPVGNAPTSIVVADFNRDTRQDIAVANSTDATVSVLLGNGNDTFQAQTTSQVNGPVQSLAVADMNGDGIPDILVTNPADSSVGVLIGVGNGTFETVMNPALSGAPYGIAVGDFNRDGKPDVIVTQKTAGTATVMLNNTLPTSPLPMGRNLSAPNLSYATGNMADAVTVADFNGDGIPDMAVAFFEDYTVQVLDGNGDGTFGTAATYNVGRHPYAIASADLNHDGHPDLVTANEADGTITVLLNNGTGGFTQAPGSPITVGTQPTGVAIKDLNDDGIPDIAVANYGSNTISILIGKGDGTFTPAATPTLPTGTGPYNVVIGDFQGNGKQDIACTNKGSANMEVYLGNGDGTFQSPTTYATNAMPTSIVTSDFNRDGNLDIAVGNSTANNISLFLGNGSGGFTASTVQTLNFPVSMAVADMNGDGIPDIVNVNPNFDDVTVLLGNTQGTFTSRWQFATGPGTKPNTCNQTNPEVTGAQPWAVAIGDFNLDGKPDVVTANTTERCNLTIPEATSWYQPALGAKLVGGAVPSTSVLLNGSGSTIALSANPEVIQYNPNQNPPDQVTINAQISPSLTGGTPTPTGTVEIEDTDGTELGIAALSLSNGTASLTLPNLGSGQHTLGALYSGDTSYQPETNIGGNVLISVSGTPVSISISPNTFVYGSYTQFTLDITVYGNNTFGSPTGSVAVYFFTPQGTEYVVCASGQSCPTQFPINPGGGANNSTTSLQVTDPHGYLNGIYEFYATYSGDSNYPPGSSADEQVDVTPTTPTVTLSCTNPSRLSGGGGTTSCTASVAYKKYSSSTNWTWVTITSGTVAFSLNGGSATDLNITNHGTNKTPDYYAGSYSFTTPPDSDGDGDSDYVLTATFTPSSGDTGMFTSATGTYCGSDGCNTSGTTTTAAARSTAMAPAFSAGVLGQFGRNFNMGGGQGYRYRKVFGIPTQPGSGGGVGLPPLQPNSRVQYGVIGKPGDTIPQFGANPAAGSSGNGAQQQQPRGASAPMQPRMKQFHP